MSEQTVIETDNIDVADQVDSGVKPESAVAVQQPRYSTPAVVAESDTLRAMLGVAETLAHTEFVPRGLRGDRNKVFAAMLTGHGLGVDMMTSLRHIGVIHGTPNLSAKLQTALVRRHGHQIGGEANRERAIVRGTRSDTGESLEVTYTIEDAAKAGHVTVTDDGEVRARSESGRPMPWETHTDKMLYHRATTTLVDRLFTDCVVGFPFGQEPDVAPVTAGDVD